MMKVQELFKEKGWQAATFYLASELHMNVKNYNDEIFVLNYNQIFSPETDEYVMECRGLILDKNGEVLGRRWRRFFNYGQQPDITGQFIFEDSEVFEKVDGSTILFWYNPYANRWEISTRGTAFAESEQLWYPSFRQAVLEDGLGVTEERFQEFMNKTYDTGFSHVFEYCSIKNRIVTVYDKPVMYLVSTIKNDTGEEMPYDSDLLHVDKIWDELSGNIRIIRKFDFKSMDEMLSTAKNLQGLDEGYVAKDKNGLRIKIKADLYLKVHKIKGEGQITEKSMCGLIVDNEQEEFLQYFPEYRVMFEPYEKAFIELIEEINHVWLDVHGIENQKEYALKVKDLPYSAILFSMRKTDKTFEDIWLDARLEYKVNLLMDYYQHYTVSTLFDEETLITNMADEIIAKYNTGGVEEIVQ
jgi:hypothetical protein